MGRVISEKTTDIYLELEATNATKQALQQLPDGSYEALSAKRADGVHAVMEVLVFLTPILVPSVTKIVLEELRARRHVKLKIDGLEVSGISEHTLKDILERRLHAGRRDS